MASREPGNQGSPRRNNSKKTGNSSSTSVSDSYDYSRLYIRSLPATLKLADMRKEFSKFGLLVECHISRDEKKNYGLVKYSDVSSAKEALAAMANKAPWFLKVDIAKKSVAVHDKRNKNKHCAESNRQTGDSRQPRQQGESRQPRKQVDSRQPRKQVESRQPNENGHLVNSSELAISRQPFDLRTLDDSLEDDDIYMNRNASLRGICNDLSSLALSDEEEDLAVTVERMKLLKAKISYKQQLRALQKAEQRLGPVAGDSQWDTMSVCSTNRSQILNRLHDDDLESNFGNSWVQAPGLVETGCRVARCVLCSLPTHTCCSRCLVTPYCSTKCQNNDWLRRHSSICHNLVSNGCREIPIVDCYSHHQNRQPKNNIQMRLGNSFSQQQYNSRESSSYRKNNRQDNSNQRQSRY